jgi:hypothetical protein
MAGALACVAIVPKDVGLAGASEPVG